MRVAKATLSETNQQFLSHTSQHITFSMPFLGVVSTKQHFKLLSLFPISIRAHTKGLSLLCFRTVSCGTYVSGVTFVSLVPVEILFGEGGRCASVAHNYNNKFPHSLFVLAMFS